MDNTSLMSWTRGSGTEDSFPVAGMNPADDHPLDPRFSSKAGKPLGTGADAHWIFPGRCQNLQTSDGSPGESAGDSRREDDGFVYCGRRSHGPENRTLTRRHDLLFKVDRLMVLGLERAGEE